MKRLIEPAILGAVLALLVREVTSSSGWLTALVYGAIGAVIGLGIALVIRR